MLPAAAALAIPERKHSIRPGCQAHLDRADDVATAHRRQHLGVGRQLQRRDHAIADLERVLGEVGPAGDDDDIALFRSESRSTGSLPAARTASVMPPA